MTKARYKLLKYAVVVVPLALVFFNPFSESLKRRFFNRYDLRWHSADNLKQRIQEITVHNSGDAPAGKIRIHLAMNPRSATSIADFTFTKFKSGKGVSFLDSVASSDLMKSANQPDEMRPVVAALDGQDKDLALYKVEQALDEMGVSKIRSGDASGKALVNVNFGDARSRPKSDWHESIKNDCDNKKYSDTTCQQALDIVAFWKDLKRNLAAQARKSWSDMAGAEVIYPVGELSPSSFADFTFGLEAHETGLLQIKFNPDPEVTVGATADVYSSSAMGFINRVEEKDDVYKPLALFMLKYRFLLLAILLLVAVAVIRFAWPEIRPKQLLPLNRAVYTALITDDHEYWEHIYQRYRFYVLQQFRKYRHLHNKPNLDPQPEELLDYVRAKLTAAHHKNPSRFKAKRLRTEEQLNRFVRARLQTLVILGT